MAVGDDASPGCSAYSCMTDHKARTMPNGETAGKPLEDVSLPGGIPADREMCWYSHQISRTASVRFELPTRWPADRWARALAARASGSSWLKSRATTVD
jgi:hypothetical protein